MTNPKQQEDLEDSPFYTGKRRGEEIKRNSKQQSPEMEEFDSEEWEELVVSTQLDPRLLNEDKVKALISKSFIPRSSLIEVENLVRKEEGTIYLLKK